jgi:hypothetical protein
MNRMALFEKALEKTEIALEKSPFMFPLKSVITQLEYLIQVEKGLADDGRIDTIDIGQITGRDIENFDEELANLLCEVFHEIRK